MIKVVVLSASARKALRKCPAHVLRDWAGFRSIRLSRAYRAIYSIRDDSLVEFALVETVNKHEY